MTEPTSPTPQNTTIRKGPNPAVLGVIAGVLAGLASAWGLDVTPEESLAIAGGMAAAVAVALRNRGHKPPSPPTSPPAPPSP